jgi:hypothetical protein
MALLPLGGRRGARQHGVMDIMVRFARRAGQALREFHRATKRASALRLSYGLAESDRAPDTYAEFLLRSRLTLLHEPPARRRACGRQVR